jgi:hypothetical protein
MCALLAWGGVVACRSAGSERPVTDDAAGHGRARRPQGVVGRVTTPDGTPVVGAWIECRSLDRPSPPIPDVAVVTGADGRYQWPLPPGRYECRAVADGRESRAGRATVHEGSATTLDFAL